jgi:hypothetical protein
MARAWIEMRPGAGWGDVRLMRTALRDLDYVSAELRGDSWCRTEAVGVAPGAG